MLERDFGKYIIHSLEATGGCGYKIRDIGAYGGMKIATQKNPFDIFGIICNPEPKSVYIESKHFKEFKAFNLKKIEPHQAYWLTKFSLPKDSEVYVILSVQVKRADLRVYIFDWRYLQPMYEAGYSFFAKELDKLPYNEVHKGIFEFKNIIYSNKD
jgi:penicillin-binding protein-related factor A (putative recombinase)